jgi:sortase A
VLNKALRLTGELFVLAALVIGLWLVYENVVTNVDARQAKDKASIQLTHEWQTGEVVKPQLHKPFAFLWFPKLGSAKTGPLPIIEGVGQADLASGVGHYPQTDLPGQYGNFAIAGHRVTHGQPFYDFPKLQVGDAVYVQTNTTWYEYRLFATKFVTPSDTYVISRSPRVTLPADAKRENLITLTTCDPAWNSYRRWIWWGTLVGTYSSSNSPIAKVTP